MSRHLRHYPVARFEGRRLSGKNAHVHAVLWHRASKDCYGRPVAGHFESLCYASPRGDADWSRTGPLEVTCPKCLATLAAMREHEAKAAAARSTNRADWPGDPACSCRGAGCCGCLAKLPALDACGDCRHISRCRALGFTSSEAARECSFIPSRYRPLLPPGGAMGEGGPLSAPRVSLRSPEAQTVLAGEGGAA